MRSKKAVIIIFAMVLLIAASIILFITKSRLERPEFLTDVSWSYYDNNIGENLNISFMRTEN